MAMRFLVFSVLVACGSNQGTVAPTPVEEAAPTPEPTQSVEPGPIVFGDMYMIFPDLNADTEPPATLFVRIEDQPKPDAEPIGVVEVHAGAWTIRELGEVPVQYETVSVIGQELCEAPVTRARQLHAELPSHPDDPTSGGQWTFLALDVEGCIRGGMGVAGASVRLHSLDRESLDVVASADVVALAKPHDDDLGWGDPLEESDFRVLQLPAFNVTIVVGNAAWVVRDGAVLHEHHGIPRLAVEAGDRLFFQMTSPSEDWAAALDTFRPLRQ